METGIDFKQLKKFMIVAYGKPCKNYSIGCMECLAWRTYEDLKQLIDDIKDIEF